MSSPSLMWNQDKRLKHIKKRGSLLRPASWILIAPPLPSTRWHELPVQNGDNYETTKHKRLGLMSGGTCRYNVRQPKKDAVLMKCSSKLGLWENTISTTFFSESQSDVFKTSRIKHFIFSPLLRWIGSGMSQYFGSQLSSNSHRQW